MNKNKEMSMLTFVDYDDTILPTTFLDRMFITTESLVSTDIQQKILDLETLAQKMLDICLKRGYVFIVTNADSGWPETTLDKFMPNLFKFIKENNIKIISAKTSYEDLYPSDTVAWKKHVMSDVFFSLYDKLDVNITVLSIGDSLVERSALFQLSKIVPLITPKSIKLSDTPTIDHLIAELEMVNSKLDEIYDINRMLDMELAIKPINTDEIDKEIYDTSQVSDNQVSDNSDIEIPMSNLVLDG